MTIAVLAAMGMELDAFKVLMTDVEDLSEGNFTLYKGKCSNTDILLLQTYVYKGYACITLTKLLENYHVDAVVNIGTEGSLSLDVKVNDVVVATKVAYHDIKDPYYKLGWTGHSHSKAYYGEYYCDEHLVEVAKKVKTDIPFHVGPMVSGDAFIDIPVATEILKNFPGALCGENEAGGVAQVCKFYNIPFIVLRAISDITVMENNLAMFDHNVYDTSDASAIFTKQFIEQLEKENA